MKSHVGPSGLLGRPIFLIRCQKGRQDTAAFDSFFCPAVPNNFERSEKLVGTARFELATPRTPSVCATGLRHVPTKIEVDEKGR